MAKNVRSRTKPQSWLSELVHNLQHVSIRSRNKKLYPKTLSKRKIRLLTIFPAGKNLQLPLACELQEYFIDFAPEYEALSYCWGNSTNQKDIICNGLTFSVTINLYEALTRLRLEDKPRIIWADAICINQSNNEEKSFQVSSMGRIFATAKRVVVWLGQAEKSHTLEIEKAMEGFQEDFQRSADSINDDTIISQMIIAGSPLKLRSSLPWNAITALYNSPWFERIWVVQEIRLAIEAIVYWGECQLYWKDIAKLGTWMAAEIIAGRMSPMDSYLEHAVMMASKVQVEQNSRLLNALSNFQGSIATDPRDNVYGILGLPELEAEKHVVTVDYTIPVADLYNEVAVAIIRQTQSLHVFQYVRHSPHYDGKSKFTSWTPRWDNNSIPSLIRNERQYSRPHFQFNLPHVRLVNTRKNKKALSLSGLLFDVVSRVDRVPDLDVAPNKSSSHSKESESESDTHPFIQYWYRHVSQDPPFLASDQPKILSLAHTITAGQITANFTAHWDVGEAESKAYMQSFLVYMNSISSEKPSQSESDHAVATEPDDTGTVFKMLAGHYCDDRVLFECPNGSYGIGPDCLREGDLIVQLEGGITPHALRQRDEGYLLLGQVYVNSIMNGELVALMKEGEIQPQEFRLI